jgi:hypothetical protein
MDNKPSGNGDPRAGCRHWLVSTAVALAILALLLTWLAG